MLEQVRCSFSAWSLLCRVCCGARGLTGRLPDLGRGAPGRSWAGAGLARVLGQGSRGKVGSVGPGTAGRGMREEFPREDQWGGRAERGLQGGGLAGRVSGHRSGAGSAVRGWRGACSFLG